MLENLFNLVKEFAGDAVVNNPEVPNEHNDAITAEATSTVAGGLQNMLAGGGLENVLSLFGGGGNNQSSGGIMKNPIVNMMIGHFAGKLMSKFGLGSNQASGVASNLIPSVISNLVSRTNDPGNSSFDINSIIGALSGGGAAPAQPQQTGGSGFDFQNILSSLTGGGSGGGGGLADIISKVTGGAQQQQQQQAGGGGLMDMIKGFMSR
jgi:hypothetical protein